MLALLLSAILLFASLPIAAIAEDGLPQEEGGAPQIYDNAASAETAEGEVLEVESLREANVKHFYMGDGTYRAVSYGTEVHRKDAEGVWQEIDNTLTLQNGYHTTPDGRIKLASSSTAEGSLLQIAENGYGIDMAMLPPSEPSGDMSMDMNANATLHTGSVTVNNAQREAVLETDSAEVKYQKLSKTLSHSKLTYANLSAGLDVSYELSGNKITEKIVVKGVRESYEFAFRLSLTGLTATLDEENIITFTDAITGEAVYRMSLPYVSLGERGAQLAAEYALEQVEEDDYLLLISADGVVEELLASVEAEAENSIMATVNVNYVTITTTVEQISYEFETGEYAYISESSPTTSYTDVEMISVGGGDIGYIYVPLPDNLYLHSVTSAYLTLFCEVEEEFHLSIHRAAQPWHNVNDFTYSYAQQNWSNLGLDTDPLEFVIESKEDVSFDVTSIVSDWHYGVVSNHGFGLQGIGEEWSAWFYRNGDDAEPILTINYTYEEVSISDGIYYLQNAMYESFMQVSDSGVVTEPLDATDAQWRFTDISDGIYTIQHVNTGKFLTAGGTTIGSEVSIQDPITGIGSYNQQWKLLVSGNHIVLCPRSGYLINGSPIFARCIGAEPHLDYNDRRDVYVYSNTDVHSSDRGWFLLNGAVRVNAIFDESYTERYGGETSSITQVRNRITQHMEYLKQQYLTRFKIYVDYTVALDDFACYACGSCSFCEYEEGSAPPDDIEGCVDHKHFNIDPPSNDEENEDENNDEENEDENNNEIEHSHHTNAYAIGYDIRGGLSIYNTAVTIAFIGHNTCSASVGHPIDSLTGITYPNYFNTPLTITIHNRKKIVRGGGYGNNQFTYKDVNEYVEDPDLLQGDVVFSNFQYEQETVLHEFGHIFFAPDHYDDYSDSFPNVYTTFQLNTTINYLPSTGEQNIGKGKYDDECIYGFYREEAMTQGNVICEGCQMIIRAYVNNYMYAYVEPES